MGYFVIKSFSNGDKFRFKFVSEIDSHVLLSAPFSSKGCCLKGIESLKEVASFFHYYVHKDLSYGYSFDIKTATGQVIAVNKKGYFSMPARDRAIRELRSEITDACVYDRS
jgi:uncharacterized protein YegP (UPF0339 family)